MGHCLSAEEMPLYLKELCHRFSLPATAPKISRRKSTATKLDPLAFRSYYDDPFTQATLHASRVCQFARIIISGCRRSDNAEGTLRRLNHSGSSLEMTETHMGLAAWPLNRPRSNGTGRHLIPRLLAP